MRKKVLFLLGMLLVIVPTQAQLPDSCKLWFGTNISGISDWGSEMPFVDMMRFARIWYTKDVDNPEAAWNSEWADEITLRSDGYPTHMPQSVSGSAYEQKVATIWGLTDGWESGDYVVLFDGTGTLSFGGNYTDLTHPSASRYEFSLEVLPGNIFELVIETSDADNPVRNIRIFRDIYEETYATHPFNPVWVEKLLIFGSVRFMDWGATNNWSQGQSWEWGDPSLIDWEDRARYDYYTWTTSKGVPYEMMVRLMNDYAIDGWVSVPHKASDEYITEMARYFREHLEPGRRLTVEYSNEIWNWMFGQCQWLHQYGCIETGMDWPEGIVPYIQNCMDIWTVEWAGASDRLTRVVGVQTGWLDVAQRTVFNMDPESYDAVAAAYYFGLNDSADAILDEMGGAVTVDDLAAIVRAVRYESETYITQIKELVADSVEKKLVFYEGGQHITPVPFSEEPAYSEALIDIHRDTSMYHLYQEWFDFLRGIQSGEEPLQLMNFSLISGRSARYGTWGILETQYQDTSAIPAPKYQAIIDNQHPGCFPVTGIEPQLDAVPIQYYPNPGDGILNVQAGVEIHRYRLTDIIGRTVMKGEVGRQELIIDISSYPSGIYMIHLDLGESLAPRTIKWIKK